MPNVYFLAKNLNPHLYISFFFLAIFATALVLGFILLAAWMIKTFKGKQLMWWAVGFVVIGLLGILITAAVIPQSIESNASQSPIGQNMMGGSFWLNNNPRPGYTMMNGNPVGGNMMYQSPIAGNGLPGVSNMMKPPVHPSIQALINFLPVYDRTCTAADCDSYVLQIMAQMRAHMMQEPQPTQQSAQPSTK